jgi:hypothetical protein
MSKYAMTFGTMPKVKGITVDIRSVEDLKKLEEV